MSDSESEGTCGQELAASAEVPDAWQALMSHVALNLEAHAAWVGEGTDAARREHDAMRAVAAAYRDMAASAERAAALMRSLSTLPAAPHDPARFDRPAFADWMRTKIGLQRAFARLLERHATMSEQALQEPR
jgi:hypothetical protein